MQWCHALLHQCTRRRMDEWLNEQTASAHRGKKQSTHIMFANASARLVHEVPDDQLLIHAPCSYPAIAADKKVRICNKIVLPFANYFETLPWRDTNTLNGIGVTY
jgi:predicted RNA polymerase sigma factor